MAQPAMNPLLGRPAKGKSSKASPVGIAEALVLLFLLSVGFWHGVHALQHVIHIHHTLLALFPLFGVAALLLFLPPILYISFASEFAGLHPLWPPHFAFLVRRLLRALANSQNGQLKVSAKEL